MPLYPSYISIKQKISLAAILILLSIGTVAAFTFFLSKPSAQLADVVITEDMAQYDGKVYKKAPVGTGMLYGIDEESTVYEYTDPDDPTQIEILYFPPGTDPAKANQVYKADYTLAVGTTQNTLNNEPIAIATAPLSTGGTGLQGNDGGTGGNTSNSPQADGGDSTPGKSSPTDGIGKSPICATTTAIYTKGSIIYCGKQYTALPVSKIDPKNLNNTIPPIDKDMGYFIYESKDGGVEIIIAPTSPLASSSGGAIYKTAQKYDYPNAQKNPDGTWTLGTMSRDGSETIDQYIPPLPAGVSSSMDPKNYQAIEDETENAIIAYQKEQQEAERKAKLSQAGQAAVDPAAAAAAQKAAEERAKLITALRSHMYELKGVFTDCSVQSFLTFPAWYRGIVDGNCEIIAPNNGDELRGTIIAIALNVIEIILQLVGYASTALIIFGGYKYLTSAGSTDGMTGARKTIMNAVIGLIISIGAVAIINTIAGGL